MTNKKGKSGLLSKQRAVYLGDDEDEVIRQYIADMRSQGKNININTIIRQAVMEKLGAAHVFEATEQTKKEEHAERARAAQQARWGRKVAG